MIKTKTKPKMLNRIYQRIRSKRRRKIFNLAALGLPSRLVDEDLFMWFQRIQSQQSAIVQLTKNDAVANGKLEEAVKVITEVAANVLTVQRASIWLLSEDHKELHCFNLYERTPDRHSKGAIFRAREHPHYFRALEEGRALDARDARTDPRTSNFSKEYLIPLGITSVLNAAIRLSGRTVGIVCHEHVGEPRKWLSDEINFAGEIADQMAQVLINCKHREAEEALKKAHAGLERRVAERTQELQEEISERKKAEAKERMLQIKILQTEKLSSIGLLAAGVAHELNSPLAGLLSLLRTYQKRSEDGTEEHEILGEMLESSERMAKIVKDLNDFSKVSEHKPNDIDFHEVIEATLSFSGHQMTRRNIKIIKNYDESLPKIKGNKSQLQQVVLNILTNAGDAMPHGGELTITTRFLKDLNLVCIEFEDTGQGIREEDLPKIFDPFFTTKPRGEGTGLGLSVSHGIIQSHKGEFLVESRMGVGSKLSIKLIPA